MNTSVSNTIYNLKSLALGFGTKESFRDTKPKETNKNKIKLTPLIGSIVGTGVFSALVINSTEKSKNIFKKILKTDFAASKNILIIGLGSVLGGLTGGIIEDKRKNTWQKIKEANFQMLSNIIFPLVFSTIFRQINTKLTKNTTKIVKNIGNFVSVFGGVGVGAFCGSVIANKVNNIIKPENNYERKLGFKDFLIHVDDLPIALAFAGIPYIDKLIPFILVSRGYDVGKQ